MNGIRETTTAARMRHVRQLEIKQIFFGRCQDVIIIFAASSTVIWKLRVNNKRRERERDDNEDDNDGH